VDLYSAYRQYNSTTKPSDVDHRVTCKYTTSAFSPYTHSLEGALLLTVSPIYRPIYYSFPVPLRVGGWVGLVGWPI